MYGFHQPVKGIRLQKLAALLLHGTLAQRVVLRVFLRESEAVKPIGTDVTYRLIPLLFENILAEFQLDEVKQCVRIAGKYAGTGCSVHAALLPLHTLGMMVAVDNRAAEFRTNFVKLIAEPCHLVGAVFVARDDLVNRVDDNGNVILLCRPANELRREFIHWNGLAAQVPHINVAGVLRLPAEACINVLQTVQARGAVEFQIDIHDFSLRTVEAEPAFPLGDRAA